MGRQSTLRRGVKHRRANSSSNQNQRLRREKVNISYDTWLEALKFMTYPQWSNKCFVNRQIIGIAEHNISRLPKMVIDSATMSYNYGDSRDDWKILPHNKYIIVAFDTIMQEEQSKEWFMNRGINLDAPVDIPAENIINGATKRTSGRDSNINICIHGAAQEKIPLSEEDKRFRWFSNPPSQQFRKPVLYYAQFNPLLNQYSWNYLAQFLKFVYHPTSYVKEVQMFAVNQEILDTVFGDEKRFIRCGSFTLKTKSESSNMDEFHKSLSWLERNVCANTIHFPEHIDYKNKNINESIASFLLSGSRKCARQEINFKCICNADSLVKALMQKFRSTSFVLNDIPTLKASIYGDNETMGFLQLDPDVMKLKSKDLQCIGEYLIFQGDKRMHIEISEGHRLDIDYFHRKYHDNWRNRGLNKFDIYIKVYSV